jgi:hypothetical protein
VAEGRVGASDRPGTRREWSLGCAIRDSNPEPAD